MYKITNISRFLSLVGLYPGESKNIKKIDDNIKELYNKQLISITKVEDVVKKQELNNVNKENNKECEVLDTDGRN